MRITSFFTSIIDFFNIIKIIWNLIPDYIPGVSGDEDIFNILDNSTFPKAVNKIFKHGWETYVEEEGVKVSDEGYVFDPQYFEEEYNNSITNETWVLQECHSRMKDEPFYKGVGLSFDFAREFGATTGPFGLPITFALQVGPGFSVQIKFNNSEIYADTYFTLVVPNIEINYAHGAWIDFNIRWGDSERLEGLSSQYVIFENGIDDTIDNADFLIIRSEMQLIPWQFIFGFSNMAWGLSSWYLGRLSGTPNPNPTY